MIELRKIQKSKTGLYINLPKKITEQLQLKGQEVVKIEYSKDSSKLLVEVLNIKD